MVDFLLFFREIIIYHMFQKKQVYITKLYTFACGDLNTCDGLPVFFRTFSEDLAELTGQKTGTPETAHVGDLFDGHLLQRKKIRDFFHSGPDDVLCDRRMKMLLEQSPESPGADPAMFCDGVPG